MKTAGALLVACLCGGCYLPGQQGSAATTAVGDAPVNLLTLVQATPRHCQPTFADGDADNDSAVPVVLSLEVRWIAIGGAVLASGKLDTDPIEPGGRVDWRIEIETPAENVLNCFAEVQGVTEATG
jgi:hypothetical protein